MSSAVEKERAEEVWNLITSCQAWESKQEGILITFPNGTTGGEQVKVAGGRFRVNEMLCLTTQISGRNSLPEDVGCTAEGAWAWDAVRQIKGKSLLKAIKHHHYTSDSNLWITGVWEESWMWCSPLCSVCWRAPPWDLWPVETGDWARQVLDPTQ